MSFLVMLFVIFRRVGFAKYVSVQWVRRHLYWRYLPVFMTNLGYAKFISSLKLSFLVFLMFQGFVKVSIGIKL